MCIWRFLVSRKGFVSWSFLKLNLLKRFKVRLPKEEIIRNEIRKHFVSCNFPKLNLLELFNLSFPKEEIARREIG